MCAFVLVAALAVLAWWLPRRVVWLDNGVIVPPARMAAEWQQPVARFWMPTRAQVADIERQLPAFVAAHGQLRSSCHRGACLRLSDYVRVIWGYFDERGRRMIFVDLVARLQYEANFAEPARRWDDLILLEAADGGDLFMGANYDVGRGLLFGFCAHE